MRPRARAASRRSSETSSAPIPILAPLQAPLNGRQSLFDQPPVPLPGDQGASSASSRSRTIWARRRSRPSKPAPDLARNDESVLSAGLRRRRLHQIGLVEHLQVPRPHLPRTRMRAPRDVSRETSRPRPTPRSAGLLPRPGPAPGGYPRPRWRRRPPAGPAVSATQTGYPARTSRTSTTSRVVPAIGETMAASRRASRFIRLDLPAMGGPRMAILNPSRTDLSRPGIPQGATPGRRPGPRSAQGRQGRSRRGCPPRPESRSTPPGRPWPTSGGPATSRKSRPLPLGKGARPGRLWPSVSASIRSAMASGLGQVQPPGVEGAARELARIGKSGQAGNSPPRRAPPRPPPGPHGRGIRPRPRPCRSWGPASRGRWPRPESPPRRRGARGSTRRRGSGAGRFEKWARTPALPGPEARTTAIPARPEPDASAMMVSVVPRAAGHGSSGSAGPHRLFGRGRALQLSPPTIQNESMAMGRRVTIQGKDGSRSAPMSPTRSGRPAPPSWSSRRSSG